MEVETSLGEIREEMAKAELRGDTIPTGMTKADYAEFKFNSALVEEDDFDMLVMGRTQGKGCYCYVNGVLKTQVDKYAKNYRYVVMDNEAGLEHVARGTLPHVDTMLLISDCSRRGIQAVARIAAMIGELELKPGELGLIVNRAPMGQLDDGAQGRGGLPLRLRRGAVCQAAGFQPREDRTARDFGTPGTVTSVIHLQFNKGDTNYVFCSQDAGIQREDQRGNLGHRR